MATGREYQELDALPAAGRGTRCSLLPFAVLRKSDFRGVVTPPCPLKGPLRRWELHCLERLHGQAQPSLQRAERSLLIFLLSTRPSPRETRAGAETAGLKPLAEAPSQQRSVVTASSAGVTQPRSTSLGCSDGVSQQHPQKQRVRGGGCSPPPSRHKAPALAGWPGRIFACAPHTAEPTAAPRRAAACGHLAGSLHPGICRQGTLSSDGLSEELLQRGRRRTRPF